MKVKDWKKIFDANSNLKRARLATLMSDLKFFKGYKRQRKTLHTSKGSIQQEDIKIIKIYTFNDRPSKYMKHIVL